MRNRGIRTVNFVLFLNLGVSACMARFLEGVCMTNILEYLMCMAGFLEGADTVRGCLECVGRLGFAWCEFVFVLCFWSGICLLGVVVGFVYCV